ncbi:MAG: hypothetical protein JWR26_2906 [Pedosphaera sp.]|nr:hypothetical protein [Pedosphaera sp.]
MSNPLDYKRGMNTKNSSWCLRTATMGAKGTGPLTARLRSEATAGALQRKRNVSKAEAAMRIEALVLASVGRGACARPPWVAAPARRRSEALAGLDLGRCHVARKWRLGGENDRFKAPDQPLAAAYRRLSPVAAAYFWMCFFWCLRTATTARRSTFVFRKLRRTGCSEVPHAGRGVLQDWQGRLAKRRHGAAFGRHLGAHMAFRQRISAGLVRPNASVCRVVPRCAAFFSKVLSCLQPRMSEGNVYPQMDTDPACGTGITWST